MIFINSNNKAVNKLNGKPKAKPAKCPKTPTSSRSRETAIENMIKERLAFMDRANTERNLNDSRIDARNNLKSYCYNLVETLENESINKDDKRLLMKSCTESLEWVLVNEGAKQIEFENRLKQMIEFCDPVVTRLSADAASKKNEQPTFKDFTLM